jgi:glutaminase
MLEFTIYSFKKVIQFAINTITAGRNASLDFKIEELEPKGHAFNSYEQMK